MQMVISQSKNNNVTFFQLNKYIKKENMSEKAELWGESLIFPTHINKTQRKHWDLW